MRLIKVIVFSNTNKGFDNMLNYDFYINSKKAIPSEYNKNQFYLMPHPMLRKFISHYTLSYLTPTYRELDQDLSDDLIIIPDGSGCLIFGFDGGGIYENCWGPTSKPVKVKRSNTSEDERMFFIEFLPGGLYALTGIHQKELKDLQCSIYDVDKNLSAILSSAVKSSKSIDELVMRVDNILIKIIENNNRMQLSIISAINKIKLSGGTISVKNLAESEYISERHLRRLFEKHIGLSVKMFSRLTRINRTVKIYKNNIEKGSFYIAQESGFFDESHLIRDFNEFCGTTPNKFAKNMWDFYNEPFKY